MEDFNANNAKIDTSIKVEADARAALARSKADVSALAALSQRVAAHTSTLSQKGNCQLWTTIYTGNGR